MTVKKVCASELYNIGSLGCKENNPFLDAVSIYLATSDFEIDTFANLALEATFQTAVRAKELFPIHGIVEIDDQSEDAQYYEAPNGTRIPRRYGKYRFNYMFNMPFETHKALQSFKNANLTLFIIDDAGNISAYSPDGVKTKGMDIGMLNPERMTFAAQDNTPAWTPLVIDLKDAKQWNENGVFINPSWDPTSLEAVSDVEVSVVGTPSATTIVLKVAYNNGLEADGSVDLIGVEGIIEADFEFVTTTPTSMVDNGDGTYTFTGTGMTSGSVDLKTPAAAGSTGSPVESTGPATITIT